MHKIVLSKTLLSNKDVLNIGPTTQYDKQTIFLHTDNIHKILNSVINYRYDENISIIDATYNIKSHMIDFLKEKKVDDYESMLDVMLEVDQLNKDFIKYYTTITDIMNINDIKININCVDKKYSDFTVEDINNIDLSRPYQVNITDSTSRYNNIIPVWQKSISTRHYDNEDEAYSFNDSSYSSRGYIKRGYDMSNIIKGTEQNIL